MSKRVCSRKAAAAALLALPWKRGAVALLGLAVAACAAGSRAPEGAAAEQPPSTDVYLLRLNLPGPPEARVSNITNRIGYDNQPAWAGNQRLLYTSQREGQTDIYQIDFATSLDAPAVPVSPTSEYSATVTPDGKGISVVRVELDSTQRLWRLPLDGSAPSVILPDVAPVGYFAWLDSTTLALFVLGSPNTLRIADTRTGQTRVVTTSIGRSLQRVPGGRRASFLHRVGERWVLKIVDPAAGPDGTFRIDSIAVMPDGADYVVWRSANELYTAAGSRILRLRLPGDRWEVMADLSGAGIRGISRLALSPEGDRLALVAEEPRP